MSNTYKENTIGSMHLDIGDGGFSCEVTDEKYPTMYFRTSHYGNCVNELTVFTNKESLHKLGEMLIEASEKASDREYCYAAKWYDWEAHEKLYADGPQEAESPGATNGSQI